jgi:hypothetical protein
MEWMMTRSTEGEDAAREGVRSIMEAEGCDLLEAVEMALRQVDEWDFSGPDEDKVRADCVAALRAMRLAVA